MRTKLILAVLVFDLACRHPTAATLRRTGAYANPGSCTGCHPQIAATYAKTGMARAFYQPGPDNTVENYTRNNRFYHQASGTWFQMLRRDSKFFQRRWQTGPHGSETNAEELRIDYIMGSGDHVRTYLHRTARGTLIELPLAWYPEHGGVWAMNPGYEGAHLETRRKIAYECMFCHNAYPTVPAHSEEPVYTNLPEGIDCQRCHGPGADHVQAAQSGAKNTRELILNPARLPADRQMEVCMQCHLQTTAAALPSQLRRFDREPFSYNPAEPLAAFQLYFDKASGSRQDAKIEIVSSAYRLRQSQCFLKSGGKLVCETCHNPHDIPRGEAAVKHYDSVCRQCHAAAFDTLVLAARHTAAGNCAGCHMPKLQTSDVPHAAMTDHLIQRRRLPASSESPVASPYHGEVVPFYPAQAGLGDAVLLAAAQVIHAANLEKGIPRLTQALAEAPSSAQPQVVLGDALRHSGQPAQAAQAYAKAVDLDPGSARALRSWGVALKLSGQPVQAADVLKRAVTKMPLNAANWYELGLLDAEQNRHAEAIAELRRAVALDPDLSIAYNNLATELAVTGQPDAAEAAFRAALAIDPYDADTHGNLAKFLASKGGFAESLPEFVQAGKLAPNNAQNQFFYGLALVQLGQFGAAAGHLQQAAHGDDPAVASRASQALNQLQGH